MCTFSLYQNASNCIITMNRDELISRDEIGALTLGSTFVYPLDEISQGTWSGVNDQGVGLCLLNRYHNKERVNPVSRGGIIPAALAAGGVDSVHNYLNNLQYTDYNPFDLFMISLSEKIHFQWDGNECKQFKIPNKPWYMFSSSSVKTEQVLNYRKMLFQEWIKKVGGNIKDPKEILTGFHLVQDKLQASFSIFMNREHSHTKSLLQIELSQQASTIQYFPHAIVGDRKKALTHSFRKSTSKHSSFRSDV